MEYRSAPYEFRIADQTAGIVEARVGQLEVIDDYMSIFTSGFWDRAVAKQRKLPVVMVDHEGRRAGRVTETQQRQEGSKLFQHATLQYNLKTQYGAEAFEDVRSGIDGEFSTGFLTEKQHIETRDGHRVMIKDEPKGWYEVSQCTVGASPGTGTVATRSALDALPTLEQLEEWLLEYRSFLLPDDAALALASSALALDTRAGARNAAADLKRIQSMHDLTAELGATCPEPDADDTTRNAPHGVLDHQALLHRAYRLRLERLGIEL